MAPFRVDAAERTALLALARAALERRLGRRSELPEVPARLHELRAGAFVTLRTRGGELRGCIGRTVANWPVDDVVAEMAVAAATSDPRFPPVARAEVEDLEVEVSLLGPPVPCTPDEVVVGRDGLVVEQGRRRGLLLPQVAIEQGWSAPAFVAATCRKAGLEEDAVERGASLWRFEAIHFAEGDKAPPA